MPFVVNMPAAILAGVSATLALITYFWISDSLIFVSSLLIYLSLVASSALLVINTGNLSSPFVALWMLVVVFANIFGLWASIPIFLTVCTFIGSQFITFGELSIENIIILIISGILPLLASYLIWHGRASDDFPAERKKSVHISDREHPEVEVKSDTVIDAIGDGVISINSQGNIQLINPAAGQIIGWDGKDAISLNYKTVIKLLDAKDQPLSDDNNPIQQVLNLNQQIRTNDLGMTTRNGNKIKVSLVVSPAGNAGAGVIAVFHDITREKAEEREQAEFISTASHEMRTPVASIEGYLGLALNPQTATIDSRASEYINKAHLSAEHLGHLFQDLLDVSKTDDGRLPNNPRVFNVVDLVRDVYNSAKTRAAAKNLRMVFKPAPDDDKIKHIAPAYTVNLDSDHIREIIDNLVENAIKYTQKGEIVIDITGTDDNVTISIRDTGIGIPAEDMPHLFQKFYRIDNANTREIGGTGLGLYLCRRLAEVMGGRVWAESKVNIGSTFYLELPRMTSGNQINLVERQIAQVQSEVNSELQPMLQPPEPTPEISHTAATVAPVVPAAPAKQSMDIKPAKTVPRSQSLTPEQIAAYVAQQRALAAQQPAQSTRPLATADVRRPQLIVPQRQARM